MCGIAGIYAADGRPIDQACLRRMSDSIAHRGPDGEGFFLDDGRPSVGLTNRRLAVIDVDGGAQPITVDDGAFTIVYNGELFNTKTLRRELEGRGHRFATHCDTEVVVRGYAEWGTAVLERLDGMWAFAIWDRDRRSVFLARDRLGIKPLVYAATSGVVVFGSEIKALLASGLVEPSLDPSALPHYLSAFAVPEPMSLFRGVRRLEAGHAMMLSPDGPRDFEYWDCAVVEEPDAGRRSYVEEIGALLNASVQRTMVSDVPLGVLLSGGIDSRLLATYASERPSELSTFTLGFHEAAYDERPAARATAHSLGSIHHETTIDVHEAAGSYASLVEAYDEPGQSLVQTHYISQFAREHVTVALSGLGGDELFSAYPTHVATNVLARLDSVPTLARGVLTRGAALTPVHRLRRLAELSSMPADQRITHELFHQTTASLRSDLLSDTIKPEVDLSGPVTYLVQHLERAQSEHPLNRLLYLYIKTYLPNELLRASDAMSMLHSLELRVPFLDHQLVQRAMAIPVAHKMRLTKGKLLLHDIANATLQEPANSVKRGFALPIAAWLQGELGRQIADTLTRDAVRHRGVFDPGVVTGVVRRCLGGDTSLVPAVMMLYSFEVWAERWLSAQPRETVYPVQITASHRTELSVIIASWNTVELTRAALRSLDTHLSTVTHEVIVVDNDSTDGSQEMIATEFPDVRLIRNTENVGFGRANNQAMAIAQGQWFLLLNSDAELVDESVVGLFERVKSDATLGVAHCQLLSPDGTLQHTTYRFPHLKGALLDSLGLSRFVPATVRADLLGGYWDQSFERDVDSVAGAFMLLRREVYEDTSGFDERIFLYGEDIEWCLRIWEKGWRIRHFPSARILHHHHASSTQLIGDEGRVRTSLAAELSMVAERQGASARALYLALGIIGAFLRLSYYNIRTLASPQDGFRTMASGQKTILKALVGLAMKRK